MSWKYLEVPQGPDRHEEHDDQCRQAPGGLQLVAARVRGRKHKHEGTNCDDWFEAAVSGPWTVIAVSDGAGSALFSRVGAKYACKFAARHLCHVLAAHRVKAPAAGADEFLQRDAAGEAFLQEEVRFIQEEMLFAMGVAHGGVLAAAQNRRASAEHEAALGREVGINDFACTLLLAAHTLIGEGENAASLIVSCQIGDGMIACVSREGKLALLGEPDSGMYAGETEFLTRLYKFEENEIRRRTKAWYGPLRALMVMSDGVADDYFPADPGMRHLYGDLVLNGIVSERDFTPQEREAFWQAAKGKSAAALAAAGVYTAVEYLTENGPRMARVRSIKKMAEKLEWPVEKILDSPALLAAGALGEKLHDEYEPEGRGAGAKLRVWLDAYYVKASFDDRTLAILYRKDVS